jgi:tripeptide aminopeptidase
MNKDQLIKTLSVQAESYNQWRMFAFIVRQLKEMECDFHVDDGCIYITKGDAETYPCIVAHMDTVHKIEKDLSIIQCGNNLTGFDSTTMTQTGIGGDDKVGIFIAMECLKHFDNIKAVFFRDEEVGCDGSYGADMQFFKDCGFVLQCDRRGNTDFITNASGIPLSSNEFMNDIKPIIFGYGYDFANGMMTDVMALKENGLRISAANISCGYYNPHEANEYVNINDVENCLDMVKDIIQYLGETRYKHKYQRKKKEYNIKMWDDIDTYGRLSRSSFFDIPEKPAYCGCCGEKANHLRYVKDYRIEMCDTCVSSFLPELNYK